MTTLQGQDAWHQLDRWNQPCGRPTYRTAVLELRLVLGHVMV